MLMLESYNLAPTQCASVILDRSTGVLVTRLSWGLLPFWAKAKKLQGSTINARIETVATKPAFRSAFKKRRCLIPMAGYYGGVDQRGGRKEESVAHPRDRAAAGRRPAGRHQPAP
ncbi:putative SOS response-associated peptidase YedK [Stenotrophomonas rhizophila]